MELNFSETAKSNIMSSASTLSFAAAASNTGAEENDFASHLDDETRGSAQKEDKYDESALDRAEKDRAEDVRADKADEAKADDERAEEKRADDKRAEEKQTDEKHAEAALTNEASAVNQIASEVNITVEQTSGAQDTSLTEAEIAALEAEQVELTTGNGLTAQEEETDALAELAAQEEQAVEGPEQNNAAIGVIDATIVQAATPATVKETAQTIATNLANASVPTDGTNEGDGLPLNQQNGEGGDADNPEQKTLGQQAAEKLAATRTKAGDAAGDAEATKNKPAAVSTTAAAAIANAVANSSASARPAAPAQSANPFNFDSLAGLTNNQPTTSQNSGAALIRVGTLPGQTQPSQVPSSAIAMQMNKNIQKGVSNFEIRLDPAQLGRVDVKMEISTDGRLTAHMVVESPETLDLLRKDANALEKALTNAGLEMDDEGMTFSLSEDNQQTASQEAETDGSHTSASTSDQDASAEDDALTTAPTYYFANNASGVDIRV